MGDPPRRLSLEEDRGSGRSGGDRSRRREESNLPLRLDWDARKDEYGPEREDDQKSDIASKAASRHARERPGGGLDVDSLEAREQENLDRFVKEAISIYEGLEVVGIAMYLEKYAGSNKGIDKEKFMLHTSPNRASTGLRYVRVMKVVEWIESFNPLPPEERVPGLERLRLVEYIELLIQKGDTMPDTYLREAQLLVLRGQESYLRSGGDFGGLVSGKSGRAGDSHGVAAEGDPANREERTAAERLKIQARLAGVQNEYQGVPGDVPCSEFLDKGFSKDARPLEPVEAATSDIGKASGVSEAVPESQVPAAAVLEVDDHDVEGHTLRFVMIDKPTAASRLHLPAVGSGPQENTLVVPVVWCQKRLGVAEAFDPAAELCLRCFGKRLQGSCSGLCGVKLRVEEKAQAPIARALEMTTEGDLPATLLRAAVRFDVAESSRLSHGPRGSCRMTLHPFDRSGPMPRKPGEIERMSSGDETRQKITLIESTAMEIAALTRRCPEPGSDRERPSLFMLNRLRKAFQNPGATYDVLSWECFLSKEEEAHQRG
eukprot:s178_g30.t1